MKYKSLIAADTARSMNFGTNADRRNFLKISTGAGIGALVVASVGASKCGGKSVTAEIGIIQSTILALKPLLPAQAALLDKISKLAGDFGAAYARGDFTSAKTFFASLADNITTLVGDVGAGSPRIQFLVAVVGIAVRAIAALLNEQATPAIQSMASPAEADRVRAMGSAEAASKALQVAKP